MLITKDAFVMILGTLVLKLSADICMKVAEVTTLLKMLRATNAFQDKTAAVINMRRADLTTQATIVNGKSSLMLTADAGIVTN